MAPSNYDDDDDKYNKPAPKGGRKPLPVPKFTAQTPQAKKRSNDDKMTTKSAHSSPNDRIVGRGGGLNGNNGEFNSDRLAAKLDFLSARVNFEGEEETQSKVHNALDRLAFATQVHNTADAFGQALTDAKDEVGEYAMKAAETMARFQATQYAAKWMPLETNVNLKPTYVKVPVSTVERLKFYEDENVRQIVAQHLIEKETILAENAGLRSLVPGLQDEVSS